MKIFLVIKADSIEAAEAASRSCKVELAEPKQLTQTEVCGYTPEENAVRVTNWFNEEHRTTPIMPGGALLFYSYKNE